MVWVLGRAESAVRVFATASDPYKRDHLLKVVNMVDDTPIPDAYPPALESAQLAAPGRTWVVLQPQDGIGDTAEVRVGDVISSRLVLRSRNSTLYFAMGGFTLAEVIPEGCSFLSGRPGSRPIQARTQFVVLAVRLVIQQIEVVFVFLQCQKDGDRLTFGANDISRTMFAQFEAKII